MTPFYIFIFVLSLLVITTRSQYNTPSSYDRDRTDQPYDRQNQNDRQYQQYDRDRNQYNQNDRYDRNQSQYGRNNDSQYGNRPYDPYNRDRNDNRDQYSIGNRDQYGNNRDQYGNNRDQYGNNRDQYGNNRDQYGNNRDQYANNRDQYGNNRDQYGNNRDQYGNNRDPYGSNRDQYGNNRDQYGNNRDQYGNNRDPYGNNRDQYGNRDRYGSNNSNRDQYGYNRDQYSGNRDQYYIGNDERNYGSPIDDGDCCPEYCYVKDEQRYAQFATKTAYQLAFRKDNNQHKVPDCTPIQFWSINRHGTRYPSVRTIQRLRGLNKIHDEILRNYEERKSYPDRGRLCPDDLDLLRRWRWNETVNEGNANGLTSQGIEDLRFLARRYGSKFDEIFREPYSENAYSFQYTDTDRTHDSYQAYIEGLFKDKAFQVHANVFNNDRLIRPSRSCNAWLYEVDRNPRTLDEYLRFKDKPEYRQMVRDVFRRLGFRYTLNESIVNDMYDLCRYEKAWNLNAPSSWCVVFNKEQLKLLEYAEDLKAYYKGGYGSPINNQIGCPPVKDLYEKFERTVNNDGNPTGNKVTVFFTHSTTIQTFLTAMGIAKDYQPLTANNYHQMNNRQWRTSKIDPFASNVAAALYKCRTGETYRVMFFLNEEPVNYPDCSVGLCNWSTVQNKLRRSAENCNLEFCNHNGSGSLHKTFVGLISVIAIFISLRF